MVQVRLFGWRLLLAGVALHAQALSVAAYDRYSQNRNATNCGACHGDFNSGNYVSSHDGAAWGTPFERSTNTGEVKNQPLRSCGTARMAP